MAITETEKKLWGELNGHLTEKMDRLDTLDFIWTKCSNIVQVMCQIIGGRKDLDNKKAGVGVRGMRDILSSAGLLSEYVVVNGKNFGIFCKCLKDISNLPRGGFLWIGSSALSKTTQNNCKKAEEILSRKVEMFKAAAASKIGKVFRGHVVRNEVKKLRDKKQMDENEKRLRDENKKHLKELLDRNLELGGNLCKDDKFYGDSGKWEKVDGMFDYVVLREIKAVELENSKLEKEREVIENFKLGQEAVDRYNWLARWMYRLSIDGDGVMIEGERWRLVFESFYFFRLHNRLMTEGEIDEEEFNYISNMYTEDFTFKFMYKGELVEHSVNIIRAKVFKVGDVKMGGQDIIDEMNRCKKFLNY